MTYKGIIHYYAMATCTALLEDIYNIAKVIQEMFSSCFYPP
jgi:hypothetical protein